MTRTGEFKVTRDNLREAVDLALELSKADLERARQAPAEFALGRDLELGIRALELIRSEMQGGAQRPPGQRSRMFTRYVVDEEERMAMDKDLQELIMRIEDVYSRTS